MFFRTKFVWYCNQSYQSSRSASNRWCHQWEWKDINKHKPCSKWKCKGSVKYFERRCNNECCGKTIAPFETVVRLQSFQSQENYPKDSWCIIQLICRWKFYHLKRFMMKLELLEHTSDNFLMKYVVYRIKVVSFSECHQSDQSKGQQISVLENDVL